MNRWWRFRKHAYSQKGAWRRWHIAPETGKPICRAWMSRHATHGWEEEWRDLDDKPDKGKICPTCLKRWELDVKRGAIRQGGIPDPEFAGGEIDRAGSISEVFNALLPQMDAGIRYLLNADKEAQDE